MPGFLRWSRWTIVTLILTGGALCQTSCSIIAADATAGLTTSVVNEFIRNIVNEYLGLGGSMSF